jgi:hypothetical protein
MDFLVYPRNIRAVSTKRDRPTFFTTTFVALVFCLLSGPQVIIRNIRIINANQDGQNAIVSPWLRPARLAALVRYRHISASARTSVYDRRYCASFCAIQPQ